MSSLTFIAQQMTIYIGFPLVVGGVLGGFLNAIVFLSLRTFRESSCALYLTAMSVANIGQLLTALLTRIMAVGFDIDWTLSSVFYCKFRVYCIQVCASLSLTCYCLATIDQYFATCSRPRWQQWCNTKVATGLVTVALVVWIGHGVPFLLYYSLLIDPISGRAICRITDTVFATYFIYCYQLVMVTLFPVLFSILFGFLAYRNVRQLAYREIPLVRRELDKQLTRMVLVQVIFNIFTIIPFAIVLFLVFQVPINTEITIRKNLEFANTLTFLLYYVYYAVSLGRRAGINRYPSFVLESICHLHLCIRTFPTSISLRTLQDLFRPMAKKPNKRKSR